MKSLYKEAYSTIEWIIFFSLSSSLISWKMECVVVRTYITLNQKFGYQHLATTPGDPSLTQSPNSRDISFVSASSLFTRVFLRVLTLYPCFSSASYLPYHTHFSIPASKTIHILLKKRAKQPPLHNISIAQLHQRHFSPSPATPSPCHQYCVR